MKDMNIEDDVEVKGTVEDDTEDDADVDVDTEDEDLEYTVRNDIENMIRDGIKNEVEDEDLEYTVRNDIKNGVDTDVEDESQENYFDKVRTYFETNNFYSFKKNTKKFNNILKKGSPEDSLEESLITNILTGKHIVKCANFREHIKDIISIIKNEKTPFNVSLVLGEWLYRKVNIYYRANKEETEDVCNYLTNPISKSDNIILKSLYIYYHNEHAIRFLCEYFFNNRYPSEYFILQMLNDVQLIQTTHTDNMLEHFLKWIRKTQDIKQQSNLLDVLLRHFRDNSEVKEIHQKMMESKNGLASLYTNNQNAHDEDITEETFKAVNKLLLWYKNNKFNTECPEGKEFEEVLDVTLAINSIKKHINPKLLEEIITRAKIDNTLFDRGFTIMKVFIALTRYISLSDHSQELITRLEEEFHEMNGLCSSGYINRFINVLQGFDEAYSIKIPFSKQLQAALSHNISIELNECVSDEIISGSYNEEYRNDYVDFIKESTNKYIKKMYEQYGENDVNQNIINSLEKLTGLKGYWKLEDGEII